MADSLFQTLLRLRAEHPTPWTLERSEKPYYAVARDAAGYSVFDDGSNRGESTHCADPEVVSMIVALVNGLDAIPAPPADEDARFQILQWGFSKADAEAFLPVQTPKHPKPETLAATMTARVLTMLELYGDNVVQEMVTSGWMGRFLVPLRETQPWEIAEVLYEFNDSIIDIAPLTSWLLDQIRADATWCMSIIHEVMDDTGTWGCWLYGELT